MEFICFHDPSMKCTCKFLDTNNSIFTAASSGDFLSVKKSIEKRGLNNFELKLDPYGYSALHLAAQNNHHQIVSYILSLRKGIDVDKNRSGCTPLLRASYSGSYECVDLLLKYGCNINACDVSFGDNRTSLHKAASRFKNKNDKFYQIIQLLLSYNADTTIRDKDGKLWSDLMEVDAEMVKDTKLIDKSSSLSLSLSSSLLSTESSKTKTILPKCYICNEAKFSFSKRYGKLICSGCMNDL